MAMLGQHQQCPEEKFLVIILCAICILIQFPVTNGNPFCPFFNNRSPSEQPGLQNCTWFKKKSCCMQQEIEATFGSVKPLQGASLSCQRFTNYLMCYICAPNQNIFYKKERLTVCEEFCDAFFRACKNAILKGSVIKELYPNGKAFCESRRYIVESRHSNACFDFDMALDTSSSTVVLPNFLLISLVLLISGIVSETLLKTLDISSAKIDFIDTSTGHKLCASKYTIDLCEQLPASAKHEHKSMLIPCSQETSVLHHSTNHKELTIN